MNDDRMLLNHSSGFAGTDDRYGTMSVPYTDYAAQLLETLRGERLKHTPGYLSVYCNDGFTMIENLVKAVTGQTYPEFVQKEIFTPLGMNHSLFPQQLSDLAPGMDIVDASVDAELARMFLLIPQNYSRDLSDIRAFTRGGEEWLRSRSMVFRPLSGVAALPAGGSTITIAGEGYAEWRQLPAAPTGGYIAINNCSAWRLYDADFKVVATGTASDSNAVLPASAVASFLLLFGSAGTAINLYLVL